MLLERLGQLKKKKIRLPHRDSNPRPSGLYNFFLISEVVLLVLRPLTGLLYQPRTIGDGDCGEIGGMKIGNGKPKYSEKPCPSAILSTTNPTCLDPGLNPGRRGGKPATNLLELWRGRFVS
jgi:hypothetical protein